MELEYYHYIIAIVGSALAGAINTLAGNGSAITLTILTEMLGLPGNMANGTNRVGIVAQTVATSYAFHKKGKLKPYESRYYIILTVVGAIAGVYVATIISNEAFIEVFRYLMIFMLVVVLVKPSRWLRETDTENPPSMWFIVPMFLALGFYGGFIQMGMGIFFLAIMVLGARHSLMDSNVIKSFIVAIYTAVVLIIFHYKGLVDWKIGAIMAFGQMLGGYYMAIIAAKHPKANIWTHRVLVVVVIVAILRLFDIF